MSTDRPAFDDYIMALYTHFDVMEEINSNDDITDAQIRRGMADADAALRAAFDAAVKESIQANKTNLDAMLGL